MTSIERSDNPYNRLFDASAVFCRNTFDRLREDLSKQVFSERVQKEYSTQLDEDRTCIHDEIQKSSRETLGNKVWKKRFHQLFVPRDDLPPPDDFKTVIDTTGLYGKVERIRNHSLL